MRTALSVLLTIFNDVIGESFERMNFIVLESNRLKASSGMLEVMDEVDDPGRCGSWPMVRRRRASIECRPTCTGRSQKSEYVIGV